MLGEVRKGEVYDLACLCRLGELCVVGAHKLVVIQEEVLVAYLGSTARQPRDQSSIAQEAGLLAGSRFAPPEGQLKWWSSL